MALWQKLCVSVVFLALFAVKKILTITWKYFLVSLRFHEDKNEENIDEHQEEGHGYRRYIF